MLSLRTILRPRRVVDAHCDIPCGIYDPEQARIEAESCLRILEKYEASDDPLFKARCIHVKEERAELTMRLHVREFSDLEMAPRDEVGGP